MRGTLWRIVSSFYVAGLVVDGGIVIEAAPILGWARHKRWADVRAQLVRKGIRGTPLIDTT